MQVKSRLSYKEMDSAIRDLILDDPVYFLFRAIAFEKRYEPCLLLLHAMNNWIGPFSLVMTISR